VERQEIIKKNNSPQFETHRKKRQASDSQIGNLHIFHCLPIFMVSCGTLLPLFLC